MKVQELIDLLQGCRGDQEVYISSDEEGNRVCITDDYVGSFNGGVILYPDEGKEVDLYEL